MKMEYADMKFRKVCADFRMIHGHRAQPPIKNPRKLALRMLSHLGASVPMSGRR
jgi:hypothetical protein